MSIGTSPFQGGGGASVADATETTAGKIRIATSTEASTGTNDTTAMTPLTVKERIDAALVGGVEYKGTFNANTGLTNSGDNLNNAEKGDLYIIDTLGTIYGQTWAVGDHLLINDNMGGSIDNSKIDKVDNTDAVTSVNGLSGPVVLNGGNVDADYSASNYTAANANIDGHLEGIDDQFALTAPLASPALTGTPTAPTATSGTNTTQIATTAYVTAAVASGGGAYQPIDAGLTSISGLTTAADKMIYTTGSDTYATTTLTSFARSLLDDPDATTVRSSLFLGTAATSASTDFQPVDAGLTSISGLTTAANKMIYTTSSDTYAVADLTSAGRALLDDADAAAQRTTLGLGTAATSASGDFQPVDAGLTSISGLTTAADKMIYTTGSDTYAVTGLTAAGRAILDDADAAAQRTTLGLGTAATSNTGDFLANVSEDSSPQLGGDLDLNGSDIVTTGNADLDLAPNGTGVVVIRGNDNSGALKLNCENNSHGVTIQAPPHSAGATYTLTLPNNDGNPNQVLETDGSGGLSWVDQSGGGGGGVTYSAITADPANAQAGYHYSCTGTFTITLATSGYSAGDEIRVKNMGTGTITIDPQTTTIDGSTTDYTLDVQYSSITLVSTGTNWEII